MTRYRCELAWSPGEELRAGLAIDVEDGRILAVGDAPRGPDEIRLDGLVVPGFADVHSHVFHRALRGTAEEAGAGSFWRWRDRMYALAGALDPDRLHALARATFAELALAGWTAVGEFHYLHHGPEGRPYVDANAMGHALVAAAEEAGVRLGLLDTCYLTGGFGRPLEGVQRRFGDTDHAGWAARVEDLQRAHAARDGVVVGAAAHSVRAVPAEALAVVAAWSAARDAPLHVHVAEQPAENEACLAATGRTPVGLLADTGVLGPRTTAVHATHLTAEDVRLLAASGAVLGLCPTTEAALADGIGPVAALTQAGVPLTLGTDSHAATDPFGEARRAEWDQRLATGRRGHLDAAALLTALTSTGQRAVGFADAGRLAVGARADLVAIDLHSVRTAGADPATAAATVVFGAAAADVTDVIVDGRAVVRDRGHVLGDVPTLLAEAIAPLREGTA